MATDRTLNRGGRPRQFDGTPVSVRLPKALYTTLTRTALQERRGLSDVIRERLQQGFVSQNLRAERTSGQS